MKSDSRAAKLLRSGIIYSAINFLTGLGNILFQRLLGKYLPAEQYSNANTALNAFMPFLGLLPQMAIMAVTHYIAHFNAIGDTSRLQGLLAGCRRFLFYLTVFGSILAIVVIEPLSRFFGYNASLMWVTLIATLMTLWTSLATGLCQGLAWFKRLGLIAFVVMVLKVGFAYFTLPHWPRMETTVWAAIFGTLAYLVLFIWWKELSLPRQTVATSPWNHEFILYLVVSAAFVVGSYCFSLSDMMVMQRHFATTHDGEAYAAAERLAFSLPTTVAPLLTVLFTNRSVTHSTDALREQLKLIGLYAGTLVFGATCLVALRHLCLNIFHKDSPEAAHMIVPLSVTMIFVGLLQAVGTWALASRWSRISLLYGGLGLGYTLLIFVMGRTSESLLAIMPFAAGTAFVILFAAWYSAMRRHKPVA